MIIGFSTGGYYKLNTSEIERFEPSFINCFREGNSNAVELHCINEYSIDYLIYSDIDLCNFYFKSLHTPDISYINNEVSKRILDKIVAVTKKLGIDNIIFHTDKLMDWDLILSYHPLPISIENMDARKSFGKSMDDVKSILDLYPFGLTLDLQHCYTYDSTMNIAQEFHDFYSDRIVEYHISGNEKHHHIPLYKAKQDIILESLKNRNIPIIIESAYDKMGEHKEEMIYVMSRINNSSQMYFS